MTDGGTNRGESEQKISGIGRIVLIAPFSSVIGVLPVDVYTTTPTTSANTHRRNDAIYELQSIGGKKIVDVAGKLAPTSGGGND